MGRVYTVQFNGVSLSDPVDLFEFSPAANKPIKLLGVVVTQGSGTTNAQFTATIQRRTGSPTSGSGGTTPTIISASTASAAAGFAAEANNTTRASAGTQQILHSEGFPAQGGFAYWPPPGPKPIAINGELLIVGLETDPAAVTFNATAYVEELT